MTKLAPPQTQGVAAKQQKDGYCGEQQKSCKGGLQSQKFFRTLRVAALITPRGTIQRKLKTQALGFPGVFGVPAIRNIGDVIAHRKRQTSTGDRNNDKDASKITRIHPRLHRGTRLFADDPRNGCRYRGRHRDTARLALKRLHERGFIAKDRYQQRSVRIIGGGPHARSRIAQHSTAQTQKRPAQRPGAAISCVRVSVCASGAIDAVTSRSLRVVVSCCVSVQRWQRLAVNHNSELQSQPWGSPPRRLCGMRLAHPAPSNQCTPFIG